MRNPNEARYRFLLETQGFVRWLAPLVRWGFALMGISLAVLQATKLLGTTLGYYERVYHGVLALAALFGLSLVGIVLGWALRCWADLVEVMVDIEVASEKNADLTEQHVIPLLKKIAGRAESAERRA